jgi:uncharacterized protein (TIGR00730 family)
MQQQPTICVFCASSTQLAPIYIDAAQQLAQVLVGNGYAIKYGGGAVGLMGALADKALLLDGKVIGVIPRFMVEVEWQHPHVETMMVTQTMHERKRELINHIDAVVALPGSSGTLEELVEVISMKKLGLFTKPIIIVNTNGFYDSLLNLMHRMVDENFMHRSHLNAFTVVDEPDQVPDAISNPPLWPENAIKTASV